MDDPTFTQIFNIIIAIALGDRAPHQVEATPGVIVGICLVIIFSLSYTYIKMYKKVPCAMSHPRAADACPAGSVAGVRWGWLAHAVTRGWLCGMPSACPLAPRPPPAPLYT